MTELLHPTALGEGISFFALRDPKFKHDRLSLSLVLPLEEDKLAQRAIVPYLLRQGTECYPSFTRLNQRLCELYGASLEASVEKLGAYQLLNLGLVSIDSRFAFEGEDMVRELAELLCQLLLEPYWEAGAFPAVVTQVEKESLKDAIRAEINDKRGYALLRAKTLMCQGEALALPRYGSLEQAAAITPQSAREAYEEILRRAQIQLMMVGSGDPEPARQVFAKRLGTLQREPITLDVSRCQKLPPKELRQTVETLDVKQGKLVLCYHSPVDGSPRQQNAARVAAALLGGTATSLLHTNVREKLSLCYYCAAQIDSVTGILFVDSGVEPENCDKAQEAMMKQMERLQQGEFEEELLEQTKRFLKTAYNAVEDSLDSLENWYLLRILCDRLESPQEALALCQSLTKEDVVEAAQNFRLDSVYRLLPNDEKEGE